VRHLEDAIKEPKNRNIALTGRYGSGKSSVLDDFEAKHKDKTLRISINTLGPDEGDEDLRTGSRRSSSSSLSMGQTGKAPSFQVRANCPFDQGQGIHPSARSNRRRADVALASRRTAWGLLVRFGH